MANAITLHSHTDYNTTWTLDTDTIAVMVSGEYITCYTCGAHDLSEGLYNSSQTGVCFTCALKYERKGIAAELILTDAQRTAAMEWDAAGVGAN